MQNSVQGKKVFSKQALSRISQQFSKFKTLLEDSTDKYALFRAKIYSEEEPIITIDFVGGNEDGNYKRLSLDYNPISREIYYSRGFSLRNEEKIKKAIEEIITFMNSTGDSFSTIYFDFATHFIRGHLFPDPKEPESYICYLIGYIAEADDPNYCLTDAIKSCGFDLAGMWR